MRIFLLLAFLCFSFTSVNCQQLYFEAGKTTSSFDYENSQGETLENLQSSNHTFLTLGYRKSIFTERLYINFNGSYNEYGAIGSDVDFDNYFEWNLSYLGAILGFDFEVFKPGNFTIYIKASAAAEFLIQGTQTLNNQVYNLTEEEDFDSAIYVFRGGLGMQYRASPSLSVFTQYMYGSSSAFKDIQGNLKINTHNFGIGLLIDILKDHETQTTVNNAQIEELKKELEANSEKLNALEENSKKLEDLERKVAIQENEIRAKEQEIVQIKSSVANALQPYKGNELTIEERNGQVYVILEDELLFRSGSWKLDEKGEKAVNDLGVFLAKNPDLMVTIEGHTDDVPFPSNGSINNNWDLSTKRAISIIQILEQNDAINPKNLIVAGRAHYDPITDNASADGKAENRRVTIIISPKLEEIFKMTKN